MFRRRRSKRLRELLSARANSAGEIELIQSPQARGLRLCRIRRDRSPRSTATRAASRVVHLSVVLILLSYLSFCNTRVRYAIDCGYRLTNQIPIIVAPLASAI